MLPDSTEKSQLNRLDLVVHTVRTLLHVLTGDDSIALIAFNDRATVVLPMTKTNAAGKARAALALDKLRVGGGTNVWDALRLGLQLAGVGPGAETPPAHVTMMLLTDGQPSIEPPRGTLATFETLTRSAPPKFTLHTFGYGYGLKEGLLPGLARAGRGIYGYVPDATMLGTVFVNFAAAVLSAAVLDARVVATATQGTVAAVGGRPGPSVIVNLGALGLDETRSLALVLSSDAVVSVVLEVDGVQQPPATVTATAAAAGAEASPATLFAVLRAHVVQGVAAAHAAMLKKKPVDAAAAISALVARLTPHTDASPEIAALADDLSDDDPSRGQLGKAVASQEWFTQWGQHYLPSVLRAHELETCVNFRDAGLQHYGGPAFRRLQGELEQLFCSLPAIAHADAFDMSAKAAVLAASPVAGSAAGGPKPQPVAPASNSVSVSSWYNARGCFHGDALVTLADGSTIRVCDLKHGMLVSTSSGTARVECLVVSPCVGSTTMIDLGHGPLLTPYHPVRVHGHWRFPVSVGRPVTVDVAAVFNVVLAPGAGDVVVGGYACATLGHGLEGPVIGHAYFGSAVRGDLQRMQGWGQGLVVLDAERTVRSAASGRVTAWVEAALDSEGLSSSCRSGLDVATSSVASAQIA